MRSNKVVFIRHGESEWNDKNLFCGWYDATLSAKGIEDAAKISAAELIKHNLQFDCAYASALKRSQQSLGVILRELNCSNLPKSFNWQLNERHYGNLTGFNKRQMSDKYGEQQVQLWRRSYDITPPPITPENPNYGVIRSNPSFKKIPPEHFPDCESLKTVSDRVLPFWTNVLLPQIVCGKRLLIVSHGTVLRAIIKHLENVSDADIARVNVPNSIPCICEIDMDTKGVVGTRKFLADENFLNKEMEKTASIGK